MGKLCAYRTWWESNPTWALQVLIMNHTLQAFMVYLISSFLSKVKCILCQEAGMFIIVHARMLEFK